MKRRWAVLGVVALTAVAVRVAGMGSVALVVVAGLLVLANVGATLWSVRTRAAARPGAGAMVAPLLVCWLVVVILPAHNFVTRSAVTATNAVGVQPILELAATAAVGVIALSVVRTLEPTLDRCRPPLYLAAVPVWVMATSSWSGSQIYATVRGGQMLVVGALAWATVAMGRRDLAALDTLAEAFLRWYVRVVLILCGLGVAFGPMYVAIARQNRGRFTWIGAHPVYSGLVIAVALVIVAAAPGRVLRMKPLVQVGCGAALTLAMHQNHTRTAWIGLVAALAVTLVFRGAVSWVVRRVGTPIAAAAVVIALYYRGADIWDYMMRNQSSDQVTGGSGRKELWILGFRALDTAFDWVFGLGYGITRSVFLPDAPWAGEAHNSLLAMLVSGGLVGAGIWLASVGRTAWDVLRGRLGTRGTSDVALASTLVMIVVHAMSADIMAEPTVGFGLWYLIAAIAVVRVERTRPQASAGVTSEALAGASPGVRSDA